MIATILSIESGIPLKKVKVNQQKPLYQNINMENNQEEIGFNLKMERFHIWINRTLNTKYLTLDSNF